MKSNVKKYAFIPLLAFILFLVIRYWAAVEWLITGLFTAAVPLIIGFCIAYVINILMSFFERHYFKKSKSKFVLKTRRPFSLILALLIVIIIIALVVMLVIPQLINCVQIMIAGLPDVIVSFIEFVDEKGLLPDDITHFFESVDWKSNITNIINFLFSGITNMATFVLSLLSSVLGIVFTAFVSIIFSIYLLIDKDKLKDRLTRLINAFTTEKWQERIYRFARVSDNAFHRYIVGQLTEALILGVLCFIGMLLLKIPYAPMISSLIAFTALVPIAGAYIGGGVGALMILTVSPIKALIFIVFLIILQQFEGNLIYPKVVGSSMGLPGIWVLVAITVGGGIAGILGMLISVPLMSTLYTYVKEGLSEREKKIRKTKKKCVARRIKITKSEESAPEGNEAV